MLLWPLLIGLFGGAVLGAIAVAWYFVYREAMKKPNDGNEFSCDNEYGHI